MKAEKLAMLCEMVREGTHSSDAQEELVWREVEATWGDRRVLADAIKAMDSLVSAARLARTKLRRLQR